MHQVELHDYIPMTEYGPTEGGSYERAWKGAYLHAFLVSDMGRKRKNNEDACLICVPEDPQLAEKRGCLFAVADGMGGASAGEFASHMALRQTTNAYYLNPGPATPDALRAAVEDANRRIFQESELNPLLSGMGTTVSAAAVLGEWAYIAHVGDSRIYLLRNGSRLYQITHDHSLVAEQMRCGLLTEEEARNHSMKNLITRAVGIKEEVKVDMFAVRLQRGDTLLLCSDGLSNQVPDAELAAALAGTDLAKAASQMVKAALDEGGSDNITAVLFRVIEKPPRTELELGAEEVQFPEPGMMTKLRRFFS